MEITHPCAPPKRGFALLGKPYAHILLISLLGLIAYSNTFDVPFQWDDKYYVALSPLNKDFTYVFDPTCVKDADFYEQYRNRPVGYLSFALNYRINGLDVFGYHLVNLAIHILNALLVYLLITLTFRTPSMNALRQSNEFFLKGNFISFFAALFFVSHPVQIQAVTYIYQRFASLVALFYLGSLVFYLKWRLASNPPPPPFSKGGMGGLYYLLALLFAVLAMKTKENAFTLPFAIALYETMFFTGPKKKKVFYLLPLALTLLIIPLTVIDTGMPLWDALDGAMKTQPTISRTDYLLTQFPVILKYLRLLFLPTDQNLDYDFPIYRSFFAARVFLSFLALLSLFVLSVYLYILSFKSKPVLKLVSFGVLWFFIALSVESSIIALDDLIFEHRIYLPSAGLFLAVVASIFLIADKYRTKKTMIGAYLLLIAVSISLPVSAYLRNNVWRSEISLWEDVVRKSPEKSRGHNNLGLAYATLGLTEKAMEHYRIALDRDHRNAEAHYNYGVALLSTGQTDEAIEHLLFASSFNPSHLAHNNLGIAYVSKGRIDDAIAQFQAALKLKPDFAEALNNLGTAYKDVGQTDAAIKHYLSALDIKPDYPEAHNNLGITYAVKGSRNNAMEHFQRALILRPNFADAHYNLGRLYIEMKLIDAAAMELEAALRINPDYWQARELLKNISKSPN